MSNKQTTIAKDKANKKLLVTREFDAPVDEVWKAWTDAEILDSWWAPKPWKARTKSMDFREGGFWLYAMTGPEGQEQWCRVDFHTIDPQKSFTLRDSFCDENGVISHDFPGMDWKNDFEPTASGTKVVVEITFDSDADLQKILEMGFEMGFTAAHENLDDILAK